jgi:hypothetical protein
MSTEAQRHTVTHHDPELDKWYKPKQLAPDAVLEPTTLGFTSWAHPSTMFILDLSHIWITEFAGKEKRTGAVQVLSKHDQPVSEWGRDFVSNSIPAQTPQDPCEPCQ